MLDSRCDQVISQNHFEERCLLEVEAQIAPGLKTRPGRPISVKIWQFDNRIRSKCGQASISDAFDSSVVLHVSSFMCIRRLPNTRRQWPINVP